jgi:hypothetical protein
MAVRRNGSETTTPWQRLIVAGQHGIVKHTKEERSLFCVWVPCSIANPRMSR